MRGNTRHGADHHHDLVVVLTPDQERWAEALAIERIHGGKAPLHIAERIGELTRADDTNGVKRWREIAHRFDQLRAASIRK